MLNDRLLRTLQADERSYRRADGGGMFIQIEPSGSKLWRFAYRFEGKQKLLAGGAYPAVSLAEARQWRERVKRELAQGLDPSALRKQKKQAVENTFERVARDWFESREDQVSARYNRITLNRFEKDVFPVLGGSAIDRVDSPALLAMLRKIEQRGAVDLAHRIRVVCGQIFKFAIAGSLARYNPAADVGPAQKQRAPVKHRAKIMPAEMGAFLDKLSKERADEVTHHALRLTILTWVRTQETRFAKWSEFEGLRGDAPLWRIPRDRMKMSREHLVPLPRQAVEILLKLKKRAGESEWVFPLESRSGVISENRMLDLLYRMGLRGKATVHGFRGTASTWANESQRYPTDAVELALAHAETNEIRGAYNSAQLLGVRREMLQDWSDWLADEELMSGILG